MDSELDYFIGDLGYNYENLMGIVQELEIEIIELEDNIEEGNIEKAEGNMETIISILTEVSQEADWGENLVDNKLYDEEFRKKLVKEAI